MHVLGSCSKNKCKMERLTCVHFRITLSQYISWAFNYKMQTAITTNQVKYYFQMHLLIKPQVCIVYSHWYSWNYALCRWSTVDLQCSSTHQNVRGLDVSDGTLFTSWEMCFMHKYRISQSLDLKSLYGSWLPQWRTELLSWDVLGSEVLHFSCGVWTMQESIDACSNLKKTDTAYQLMGVGFNNLYQSDRKVVKIPGYDSHNLKWLQQPTK